MRRFAAFVVGSAMLALVACRKAAPLASQCKTALLETTSCRGEDTSFQECHYFFRAEGKPDPTICRAFTSVASGPRDAGGVACDERAPSGWTKVPCKDYRLPDDNACFTCTSARHEETRHLLQAFTPNCERATVLKTCNVDLARSVGL